MREERRARGKLRIAYGLLEVINPLSAAWHRYSARVAQLHRQIDSFKKIRGF